MAYVILVLFLTWTVCFLDRLIINFLVTEIRADLAINDTQISLLQGLAFTIAYAFAALPVGRLVDRSSRRNILIAGTVLWSLMTVACGLSQTYEQFFIARMGVGLGEACLIPASLSLLADVVRPEKRARAIGLVYTGSPVGTALSGIIGGSLLVLLSGQSHTIPLIGELSAWRVIFVVIGFAGLPVALALLPVGEPKRHEEEREVVATQSFSQTLSYLSANKATFILVYIALAGMFCTPYAVMAWSPAMLIRRFDVSAAEVGLAVGVLLLCTSVLSAPIGGQLADMLARKWPKRGRLPLLLGAGLSIPCVALLSLGPSFPLAMAGLGGVLFFSAGTSAVSYAVIQDVVPNRLRGQAIAATQCITVTIGGAAPTFVALLTDYGFGNDRQVNLSILCVSVPTLVLATVLFAIAIRPFGQTMARLREAPR